MAADDPKELEYEGYRRAARAATEAAMFELAYAGEAPESVFYGFHLTAISDDALYQVEAQWPGARFSWRQICGQARPYVRRFEVAMWVGPLLEGLCIGKPSRGRDNVTLHFIERSPGFCQLKGYVAQIAADAADNYARVIGQRRLKLRDPLEGAIPLYRELDFTLAETYRGSTYYERIVQP